MKVKLLTDGWYDGWQHTVGMVVNAVPNGTGYFISEEEVGAIPDGSGYIMEGHRYFSPCEVEVLDASDTD